MKSIFSFIFVWLCLSTVNAAGIVPQIKMSADEKGLSVLSFDGGTNTRNYIDKGKYLGDLNISYKNDSKSYSVKLSDVSPKVLENSAGKIQIFWQLPADVRLYQTFGVEGDEVNWYIEVFNRSNQEITITDMSLPIPIGEIDESIKAPQNLNRHFSLNGNASFLYWIPYTGQGETLLLTMHDGTSIEYATNKEVYYLHSQNSVDRTNDTWRIPSSTKKISSHQRYVTGFNLSLTNGNAHTKKSIYDKGGVVAKVAPGMVVPISTEILCALKTKLPIDKLTAESPTETEIKYIGENKDGTHIYKFGFSGYGENMITVNYGGDKSCYLDFFVTEPLETLIKKRSQFIVTKQQHRDLSKWYNGLYSLWDMEKSELLSPDYLGDLREEFMVGGSDDPSNSKPIYVSEKNVIYPNKEEIASLEYYQQNFVWGKLQRTDKEYPYPYGIYGSENWYRNRSGKDGSYEDGGSGKGRMWRTFDYTTHFSIYYNLYLIAKHNPEMVSYLDADGYLERAYRTAMAYFEIPYNILMGKQWAFHGWTDWAYKQGNFHERYLLYIIDALEKNGRGNDAGKLRREWEKKVTYMIYEDPWPFGSEMFVDRTAFESSYYIAEYAKLNTIEPQEQFWYDKNEKKWYSYTSFDTTKIDLFMQNQLDSNLALRGLFEPGYANLGTAWSGRYVNLDYMTQMGGVAILDYGYEFSTTPAEYINYGYNSLLASWALVNSGTKENNYGYWYKGKENDGAVGWAYSPYQNSRTYMNYIKVGRKPWRYDGEIDHGLTGGIHGSGIYLVEDPDFGNICYGGKLNEKGNSWNIIPLDGIRKRIRLAFGNRFSMELEQDGFSKDTEVSIDKNLNKINFFIENRSDKNHNTILILRNLDNGSYLVTTKGKDIITLNIDKDKNPLCKIEIPVAGKHTQVEILKQ